MIPILKIKDKEFFEMIELSASKLDEVIPALEKISKAVLRKESPIIMVVVFKELILFRTLNAKN